MSVMMTPAYSWFAPFVSGLGLTYATTTTMTVAAGSCTDVTDSNVIVLDEAVTLDLTLDGPGGIDTGVLTASTFYAVFVVASTSYPGRQNNSEQEAYENPYPASAVLSPYVTEGTVPTPSLDYPYNLYKYVGSVYINASSQISIFDQSGSSRDRTMWYDAAIASSVTAGTSTTYANVDITESVPYPGLEVLARVALTPNSSASQTILAPYGSTSTGGMALVKGQVAAVVAENVVRLTCGSNTGAPYLLYKTTSASDSVAISVAGYIDQL